MDEKKIKETVSILLKNNILPSPDIFESEFDVNKLLLLLKNKDNILVINKDLKELFEKNKDIDANWIDLEESRVLYEKNQNNKLYKKFLSYMKKREEPLKKEEKKVKVIFSYKEEPKKREVQDFVNFFNNRFYALEKILRQRRELTNLTSIGRIKKKKNREEVSIIGMVLEKQFTKNNNLILTLEDVSSNIKVIVNKNKPTLFEKAKDIVLDEVIGVVGVYSNNVIFANEILWPDFVGKELKKSNKEEYCLFLSDLHVGSSYFLPEHFNKFLDWINCKIGDEKQREIASKVKYIFIVGDLIDGCGIYPGQEEELIIKDVKKQYEECARLLSKIPKNINLILCPGNHDALRIAEPQPEFYRDFAAPLYALENVTIVSNPAIVNIASDENFPGFDVLLYHGYSFDYYVHNVDSIRNQGGYDRADLIMKFLLKRRHLAPTYTSTLYIPDSKRDPLVIERIPDFFVSGHIHKTSVSNYKGVTLICGSCWQSKTPFQEKVGHHPEPARVPIVNLKTRDIKILRF